MLNDQVEINEISYRRTKNLGDYESMSFEAKGCVIAEDPDLAFETLKNFVDAKLGYNVEKVTKKKVTKKVSKKAKTTNAPTHEAELSAPNEKIVPTKKRAPRKSKKVESKADEVAYTLENVQTGLKDVWKAKGKNIAMEIVKSFGVEKSADLNENDYNKVMKEVERCLK